MFVKQSATESTEGTGRGKKQIFFSHIECGFKERRESDLCEGACDDLPLGADVPLRGGKTTDRLLTLLHAKLDSSIQVPLPLGSPIVSDDRLSDDRSSDDRLYDDRLYDDRLSDDR
jgi:hypothetical protein